jgi:hypothetical protein
MNQVGDVIHFDVVLYGWTGELLDADRPAGICRGTAPKGSLLWDFVPQWLQRRPKAREYFLDRDHRLKSDVMVILNGKYQSPKDEVELLDGATLVLLRVASGG